MGGLIDFPRQRIPRNSSCEVDNADERSVPTTTVLYLCSCSLRPVRPEGRAAKQNRFFNSFCKFFFISQSQKQKVHTIQISMFHTKSSAEQKETERELKGREGENAR